MFIEPSSTETVSSTEMIQFSESSPHEQTLSVSSPETTSPNTTARPRTTSPIPPAPLSFLDAIVTVATLPGLSKFGAVKVLYQSIVLGVPDPRVDTTYHPFEQVRKHRCDRREVQPEQE